MGKDDGDATKCILLCMTSDFRFYAMDIFLLIDTEIFTFCCVLNYLYNRVFTIQGSVVCLHI